MGAIDSVVVQPQQSHSETKLEVPDNKHLGRVAIVTDSASNLPPEVVEKYGITVVPIYLHWDGEIYLDGVDISTEEVYRRLRATKRIPRTAAPSVGDFLNTYLSLSHEVEGILSIHLPEELSGTVASARVAAELACEHIPVHVVDTGTAAMAAGFVALASARAAFRGEGLQEVERLANEISPRATVFAMVDTLEYLYRGGRIGKAEALLGVALRIKPILTINGNKVDVLAKPRTRSHGIRLMLKGMAKRVGDKPVHVAVLHADSYEDACDLKAQVVRSFHCVETFICSITPVMGAHTGPGLLGIAFYSEE
jgi:DegV family protein with EDD domain